MQLDMECKEGEKFILAYRDNTDIYARISEAL
jgi:hypothetical protein